jgi:hypothetical protein
MSTTISVIQSSDQFNLIFDEFKKSAKITQVSSCTGDTFLVGLDTEYISKDNSPESFGKCSDWVIQADKIAICKLQLATGTMCLVIDLCKFNRDLPDNLIKIITCDSWMKVGVGISNDLRYLSYNFNLGQCSGGIDIKNFAQLRGTSNPNLLDIYISIDGSVSSRVRKIKSKDFNVDWSKDMTIEQIEYAGTDAIMSHKIGQYFIDGITRSPQFDKLKCDGDTSSNDNDNKNKSKNRETIITVPFMDRNYIGILQEYCQKKKVGLPTYKEVSCDGSAYKFKISCKLGLNTMYGFGSSKKEAKMMAAEKMLELIS